MTILFLSYEVHILLCTLEIREVELAARAKIIKKYFWMPCKTLGNQTS